MSTLKRHALACVHEALSDTPVVVVQGARQTGKSTLVEQVAKEYGARVLTMDDTETRAAARMDLDGFARSAPGKLLIVDEIQRVPELILPIKAAVDADRRAGMFLLTGSADLLRVPGAQDSLAGRAETVRLGPFTQGEIHEQDDDFVTKVLSLIAHGEKTSDVESTWKKSDYVKAICAGGLYSAFSRDNSKRRKLWFTDYVERLLHDDAEDITHISPHRLNAALSLIAVNQSGELVMTRYADNLGISESSFREIVEKLTDLYLVERVPAWSRSLTQRQIKKPKAMIVDSGLCAALNNLGFDTLVSPLGIKHLGGLLEGFVVNELLRQRSWSETEFFISHFRESRGAEVDCIIDVPGKGVLAIEVKASTSLSKNHFSSLAKLREKLGDEFIAGIVLYTGQRQWGFGDRMLGMPVSSIWEL